MAMYIGTLGLPRGLETKEIATLPECVALNRNIPSSSSKTVTQRNAANVRYAGGSRELSFLGSRFFKSSLPCVARSPDASLAESIETGGYVSVSPLCMAKKKAKKGRGGKSVSTFDAEEIQEAIDDVDEEEDAKLAAEEAARLAAAMPRFYRKEGPFLRLDNISKTYPKLDLLKSVTWEVKEGERIGLVGMNGAGKTTQLKMILGQEEPSGGEIYMPPRYRVSYLAQEFEVDPKRTVKEEFWNAFGEELSISGDMAVIEERMGKTTDMKEMQTLIDRLGELQKRAEGVDMYAIEAKIKKMMPELGFAEEDEDRLVATYSGGWQMRMSLGKILLQEPDCLLLDEPTNHLDLEAIEWLENYLKSQKCAMVIVSHDREFLDRICTRIVETEMGVSTVYEGNYSRYVKKKEDNEIAQQAVHERQQKELRKQQAFIAKFSASAARGSQAKSRQKMLDRKSDELVSAVFKHKRIKFEFPEPPRSGREVIVVDRMSHAYADKVLFEDVSLLIERGDRVAFVGPNGVGKSTLLKLLMGYEKPNSGEVRFGDHNVIPAYFAQCQAEAMGMDNSALQVLEDTGTGWKHEDMRALLGKFLFKGDAVQKRVKDLSGGEKARLALARMLMTPANVLLLDEVTNHVDIPGKEVLEETLGDFPATIVIVSHDRYFISKVATKIVEVRDKKLITYLGDYKYYLSKLAEEGASSRLQRELSMWRDRDAEGEEEEEEEASFV